jgi:hypothetical protein
MLVLRATRLCRQPEGLRLRQIKRALAVRATGGGGAGSSREGASHSDARPGMSLLPTPLNLQPATRPPPPCPGSPVQLLLCVAPGRGGPVVLPLHSASLQRESGSQHKPPTSENAKLHACQQALLGRKLMMCCCSCATVPPHPQGALLGHQLR